MDYFYTISALYQIASVYFINILGIISSIRINAHENI
jgi:hypothetical protein